MAVVRVETLSCTVQTVSCQCVWRVVCVCVCVYIYIYMCVCVRVCVCVCVRPRAFVSVCLWGVCVNYILTFPER